MSINPNAHPLYATIHSISAAVLTAERDMDTSIAAIAKLVTTTISETHAARLPAGLAQKALAKLGDTLQSHIASRQMLIEVHQEYGRVAATMGQDPDSWGPMWPCPQGKVDASPANVPLRVAA